MHRLRGATVWNCWSKEEDPFSKNVERPRPDDIIWTPKCGHSWNQGVTPRLLQWYESAPLFFVFSLIHYELDFGH